MINEDMQNATKSLTQNEKAIKFYDEYEITFYEENFKILHNTEFIIVKSKFI
jgi:hypothetical protein